MSAVGFEAFYRSFEHRPVYVLLGVQGSGTNLLSRLLRRAFNMSVLHDQSLVVRVAGRLDPAPTAREVERAFQQIRAAIFPGRWHRWTTRQSIHPDGAFAGIERQFAAAAPRNGADLARFVYAYRAFTSQATTLAIKSDDIWAHMPALDRVLPHRRIVLLTRDFRDNVVSVTRKPFGPVEPVIAAAYVRERFGYYEREYQGRHRDGCHVRFEDLLQQPRSTLVHLAQRLDLEPDSRASDLLTTFPFRSGRVGRWRTLSERDLVWCESLLRRELVAYGYGLETAATRLPSRWDRAQAAARDAIYRLPHKARHLARRLRH